MKPVQVKITASNASIVFDDDVVHSVSALGKGEQEYAVTYLTGVFDLAEVSSSRGTTRGTVGVEQSISDWAVAMKAHLRAAEDSDVMVHADVEGALPEQYVDEVIVQRRLAVSLAGLFEDLSNAN